MRFIPKNPRATHLFLLVMFLWQVTEQAYVDERHMEAFLEGSVDGIIRGLKRTVNQTIETKLAIIEKNMEEKISALEEKNKEKITALEEKNKEKMTALEEKNKALETKFTALQNKHTALKQERIKDLAQIRKEIQEAGHYRCEVGNVDIDTDPSPMTSKTYASVSFARGFSSNPTVVVAMNYGGDYTNKNQGMFLKSGVDSITTSGFRAWGYANGGTSADYDLKLAWVACGQ